VRDNIGEVALVAYYNPLAKVAVSGVIVGTGGIAAAAPGVSLTVANIESGNGTPTGGVYTDDIDIQGAAVDFKKISANATRYKFI
jgi:hypothetical protein